jgi:lanosterol synthase
VSSAPITFGNQVAGAECSKPRPPDLAASTALDRGMKALLHHQRPEGCWEGEMVWCTMILSQYVIVQHIVGRSWDEGTRSRIVRHYEVTRRPDGSWGLHPESAGYVFTTTMAYVALRLLGLRPEHPLLAPARTWLHAQPGGVLANPTWGKFWLALLGLYDYTGINPSPPEMFLLPHWLPVHPRRFYCHTRYIYLAIAYLYGCRFQAPPGPRTHELRHELYGVPYETIDFAAWRHVIAATDLYVRPGMLLRMGYALLAAYERFTLLRLRRRALAYCFERIVYEQRTSRYQALSPVNGLLNCLVLWSRDPSHPDLRPSLAGLESWKWENEAEGQRYAGARSQTWDTAFAMQALLADPALAYQAEAPLRRAYAFLRQTQCTDELSDYRREGRDPALGGWCFSDGQHRWPVSDCTAEALSAVLAMHNMPGLHLSTADRIPEEHLYQAMEFILRRQNADGGFGTYERRRGSRLLELVNPSEMYGSCMTEGSYLECTGSSLSALAHWQSHCPEMVRKRIDVALARGIRFLRRRQRPDGSFAGFWGINFTYAIFHVVRGLRAAGVASTDPAVVRATSWLLSKQRADGGWGEHYTSCLRDCYVEHRQSQVVMTSWALLALLDVLDPRSEPIRSGLAWLRAQQQSDGSWPSEAVAGVFFGTAMLDYRLYRSYFPIWAPALASKLGSDQQV